MPAFAPPSSGTPITMGPDGKLVVPNDPIIPFIEGDGTGRDIWRASVRVFDAAVAKAYGGTKKVAWWEVYAGEKAYTQLNTWLPDETVEGFKKYLVGIKGPLTTPVGGGIRSLNVTLRQVLDLYVCLRPVRYFAGVPSPVKRPEQVDVVIFRENTEDIYAGIEFEEGTDDAKKILAFLKDTFPERYKKIRFPETSGIGIKPVSVEGSERLIRKAYQYAIDNKRKSVTLVHKGNIQKFTEGGFDKEKKTINETLLVGEKADEKGEKRYARLAGDKRYDRQVFKVNAKALDPLLSALKEPASLRDRSLVKLEVFKIDAIDVRDPGKPVLKLRGTERGWRMFLGDKAKGIEADAGQVAALLDALLSNGIAPERIIAGIAAPAVSDAAAQWRLASERGCRTVLLTPPFYFKDVPDEGLERWFAALTEKRVRRGSYRSTKQLQEAIRDFIQLTNEDPKPFTWTKSADDILAAIQRFCLRTQQIGGTTESGH